MSFSNFRILFDNTRAEDECSLFDNSSEEENQEVSTGSSDRIDDELAEQMSRMAVEEKEEEEKLRQILAIERETNPRLAVIQEEDKPESDKKVKEKKTFIKNNRVIAIARRIFGIKKTTVAVTDDSAKDTTAKA